MIRIGHISDEACRRREARAALAGMSLSECVLAEARRSLERTARRRPVNPRVPAAEIVRGERDRV